MSSSFTFAKNILFLAGPEKSKIKKKSGKISKLNELTVSICPQILVRIHRI